jgi:hypothetical protein
MKATASTLIGGTSNILLQWSLMDRTCSQRWYSAGPFKGGRDGSVTIIDHHHSAFITGTMSLNSCRRNGREAYVVIESHKEGINI